MVKLIPISREEQKNTKLKRLPSFEFTRAENAIPIFISECSRLLLQSPIVFRKDTNGKLVACSLLGISSENSFITNKGHWKKPYYVPALFRVYPFSLQTIKNQEILCVDDTHELLYNEQKLRDEGLLKKDGTNLNGVNLFNEDGTNSDYLNQVLGLLKWIKNEKSKTTSAIDVISSLDLFKELDLKLKIEGTDEKKVLKGLWKIDIEKLNSLNKTSFGSLKEHASIALIYGHIFSMQSGSFENLGRLLNPDSQGSEVETSPLSSEVETPTFKDRALNKEKAKKALELDSLVKNLLLDD